MKLCMPVMLQQSSILNLMSSTHSLRFAAQRQLYKARCATGSISQKMDRYEIRAVIKYLFLKGLTPQEIHEDMSNTVQANCPSYSTVKNWVADFKRGRKTTSDEDRSGRPADVTTPETIDAVHNLILNDRRSTIRFVAETLNISYGAVQTIIKEKLEMSKLSARWVPRALTPEMKLSRLSISEKNLQRFRANQEVFLSRLITQDETWVHHFDVESKQQSKQWKHKGSPPPRKFKVSSSAGKVMASIFWDTQGVLMIDCLSKGQTINGEYYADLLVSLRENIKQKRRGLLAKGVILLQDNAPSHRAQIAVATAHNCGYEILDHPAYSPDLAPSDFYLFPKLKSELKGKSFLSLMMMLFKLLRIFSWNKIRIFTETDF